MEEKRLIDANALVDIVNISKHDNPHKDRRLRANHINEHNHFLRLISESKTVNAVEVVVCRDCTYWGDEDGKLQGSDGVLFARCKAHNYLIDGRHTGWCPSENDFCSYGERKDGDD